MTAVLVLCFVSDNLTSCLPASLRAVACCSATQPHELHSPQSPWTSFARPGVTLKQAVADAVQEAGLDIEGAHEGPPWNSTPHHPLSLSQARPGAHGRWLAPVVVVLSRCQVGRVNGVGCETMMAPGLRRHQVAPPPRLTCGCRRRCRLAHGPASPPARRRRTVQHCERQRAPPRRPGVARHSRPRISPVLHEAGW